ncbi:hypothetical protein [Microvirga roseola]|uniref:hypothetical protein n=1 Tax=Microvirga roseola TaxID=2883126 RepID=UPI001E578FE9|nr:hypothetical protein [Microvirga roseola]
MYYPKPIGLEPERQREKSIDKLLGMTVSPSKEEPGLFEVSGDPKALETFVTSPLLTDAQIVLLGKCFCA